MRNRSSLYKVRNLCNTLKLFVDLCLQENKIIEYFTSKVPISESWMY